MDEQIEQEQLPQKIEFSEKNFRSYKNAVKYGVLDYSSKKRKKNSKKPLVAINFENDVFHVQGEVDESQG